MNKQKEVDLIQQSLDAWRAWQDDNRLAVEQIGFDGTWEKLTTPNWQFRNTYYRIAKPKPILWMETGWAMHKKRGTPIKLFCVGPLQYLTCYGDLVDYDHLCEIYTPATLAEVQEYERKQVERGE